MEPHAFIENFLNRVRRLHTRTQLLHGFNIIIAYISISYLTANLLAWFYPAAHEWSWLVGALFLGGLGYIVFRYILQIGFVSFSLDDAALLTELRHPHLNNSLINSCQLARRLKCPEAKKPSSLEFIHELHRRTRLTIEAIDPRSVIDRGNLVSSRNWFVGALGSLILVALFLPDFLTQGYNRWMPPPKPHQAAIDKSVKPDLLEPTAAKTAYAIDSLSLTFHFPAYTKMRTKTVKPSNGKIHVLPGSEVKISARTNLPTTGGDLIFNGKDNFVMSMEDPANLNGRLLIKEKGFYQFRIKDAVGKKHLLAQKYPVTLGQDRSPSIVLFLANPKPVYFNTDKVQLFYEGSDDFGIGSVELVAYINGKIQRFPVKRFKEHEKEAKGDYTWALSQIELHPGDEVQYYLEIKDNDNVRGPNTGQSEAYTFTIFDSAKELESLIALQEELTEKMIALLATGLVKGASLDNSVDDPMQWEKLFTTSTDALIEIVSLAQRIRDRGKTIDRFPQPYLNLLNNVASGLARIRQEQIEAINQIRDTIHKPTQAKFDSSSPYRTINNRMIGHLENDILFLVKMTNRQKLDRVVGLEEKLNNLTQTLRQEFEKLKDRKTKPRPNELKSKIKQIRDTLQKIMDQLARQTQSMPDEFLNSAAFKRLSMDSFAASLERMMDMVNRGQFEEAMEELKKVSEDLQQLANQFNQARSEMDDLLDMQIAEALDDSIEKLDKLEARQQRLVEDTTQVNQELREQQSKRFEKELDNFFKELQHNVDAIRSLFKEDEEYLNRHRVMKQLEKLMAQETKLNRKINELGQKTVDSSLTERLDQNFQSLNEARKKLSKLTHEKDSLRVNEFQRFREGLPQLMKKYDTLRELARLRDLTEFGSLFKKAYPEVFRWQNNLRTTPNRREDIGEQLDNDLKQVTRLNNEISKKLGSMMRSIRKNYDSSITEKQKKKLGQMAQQESQMRKEVEELTRRFDRLNQENPMVPSQLSKQMGQTGRRMKRAERNLKEQNIRESIEAENHALKGLRETRDLLKEMKNSNGQAQQAQQKTPNRLGTGSRLDSRRGGGARMRNERVLLPSEDQYQVPREFREEILNAMKKQTPKDYQRMVMEYYKNLVK